MNSIIYLDNNATTRIDERVLNAMMPFLTDNFANASSSHKFGVTAFEAVKTSRECISKLINADVQEIVFTSGATEAINLAIKGVAENYISKGKHIITANTEHNAVLDTCRTLESKGYEVTYLPVSKDGLINLEELKNVLRIDTILVSIMYVNNETGVIQPIKEIADLTHSFGAIFMTDATQAIGKFPINVKELGIDLLSMSGHKIYAPKGIGALYVRQGSNGIKLSALLHGGGHERGMRSGTLNVPGIVGLGKACEIAKEEMNKNAIFIKTLRDYLEIELLKIDGTLLNGNAVNRLYSTTNISFKGLTGESIVSLSNPQNDLPLIAVSNSSACTSASGEPSHVLTAMGLEKKDAYSSIRFSIGKYNTKKEIDIVIDTMKNITSNFKE